VEKMPERFFTKDVSERADMKAAHPVVVGHRSYHAFVGSALKRLIDDHGELVLDELRKGTRKGSEWARCDATRKVATGPASVERSPSVQAGPPASDIGPQSSGDRPFTARIRRHQSWYRAQELAVPCGIGPTRKSRNHYGNMLRQEDGTRGMNFLTDEIHQVALERLRQGDGVVEEFRLLNNMLSSQPMCFNLFGPLVHDLDRATRLFRALLGEAVQQVTQVRIEYAPSPASEFLDDRTAFDAYVEYLRPDGGRAFVGIETKLTEPFSQKHYDRASYRRWMKSSNTPWRPECHGRVDEVQHNQLWRDHLLAIAMRDHANSLYVHGSLALVSHPGDGECQQAVETYRSLLVSGDDTFDHWTLDRLIEAWHGAAVSDAERSWLESFHLRYLDLAHSAG